MADHPTEQVDRAVEVFDSFIRDWVPPAMQGHLLDDDDNAGERVRRAIRAALDAATPSRLSDLEQYLVDRHFQYAELQRQYSPSGIYNRVQWFLTHDLDDALVVHERSHDDDCELFATGYRNCECWRRRPVGSVGERDQ